MCVCVSFLLVSVFHFVGDNCAFCFRRCLLTCSAVLSLLHTAYFSGVLTSGTSVASVFYCAYDLQFLFVREANPREKAFASVSCREPFCCTAELPVSGDVCEVRGTVLLGGGVCADRD